MALHREQQPVEEGMCQVMMRENEACTERGEYAIILVMEDEVGYRYMACRGHVHALRTTHHMLIGEITSLRVPTLMSRRPSDLSAGVR